MKFHKFTLRLAPCTVDGKADPLVLHATWDSFKAALILPLLNLSHTQFFVLSPVVINR